MGAQTPGKKPQQKEEKPDRRRKLHGTRKERIAELLKKIEAQLDVGAMKVTLADFIRLTQLERELEQEDQPREIIVTWNDLSEKNVG
jgi:hypothetical protein